MQITQLQSNGVSIVAVAGRIDATTAEQFKQTLLTTTATAPVLLLIDFVQVDFISSIGLRVLVVTAKRVAAVRGKLVFCGLTGAVREVFELAGFTAVAPSFSTREEALASLS